MARNTATNWSAGLASHDHNYQARMALADRIGGLRGTMVHAMALLKGYQGDSLLVKEALKALDDGYEADNARR